MATKAPDPREFKSWEDAFQYPIPVVRKLEQQLRGNIDGNREKLRSLVGASYRDLLGTAERIIDMDSEMKQMETVLGDVGRKCSARSVETRAANYAKLAKVRRDGVAERRGLSSTIALLQACMTAAGRLVKRNEKPLLAAKLLVLARLLHNSASRTPESIPALDNLRTKLGALRRRLLNALDRQLGDVALGRLDMLDALTAFSLATSSTPTDVLRHFLHVRQERLTSFMVPTGKDDILTALDSIFLALRQIREIFPKRMADSLVRLKGVPLLQDPDVRAIDELDLDLYERWIADDVRKFTPWPRHDELSQSQAARVLEPWSVTACNTITSALRELLDNISEPQEVADLREQVIRHLLASKRDATGLQSSTFLQDLRTCFSNRLATIITGRARALEDITDNVLHAKQKQASDLGSLWDPALADLDLRSGAVAYRQQILARNLGKDLRLQGLSKSLDDWAKGLDNLRRTIKTMRDIRWDDDLEFDDDDDADAGQNQASMSGQDPNALSQQLQADTRKAFSNVLGHVRDELATSSSDQDHRTIFFLRVTKELMGRQIAGDDQPSDTADIRRSLLDDLHSRVAEYVCQDSMSYTSKTSAKALSFDRSPATTLWEGTPPLPVQPSPTSIRFLHEVRKTMQSAGGDLWTKAAVDYIKERLIIIVKDAMEKITADPPTASVNGASDAGEPTVTTASDQISDQTGDQPTEVDDKAIATATSSVEGITEEPLIGKNEEGTKRRGKLIQAVFDTVYLQNILANSTARPEAGIALDSTTKALGEKAGLETSSVDRVRRSATEYHKRTYLLFGILSP